MELCSDLPAKNANLGAKKMQLQCFIKGDPSVPSFIAPSSIARKLDKICYQNTRGKIGLYKGTDKMYGCLCFVPLK